MGVTTQIRVCTIGLDLFESEYIGVLLIPEFCPGAPTRKLTVDKSILLV